MAHAALASFQDADVDLIHPIKCSGFLWSADKTDERDCSAIQPHGTLANFLTPDDAKSV